MQDHRIQPQAIPCVGFATKYGQANGALTLYECKTCGLPMFFDDVNLATNTVRASCEGGHWTQLSFQRSALRKI